MKKFLVVMLALIMVLSLAACTNDGKTPAGGKDETIKIGILQDITGRTATLGKMVEAGVKYAVDEINAAGGIDGKKIETITRDTKGDVTEATNAFDLLCTQDKVSAIVGPPVANIGLAIAPKSEDYDVPLLGFAIDTATLQKPDGTTYKNMFLFQPSDQQQGTIMAKYTVEELGLKKIGLIFRDDNAYSVGLAGAFKKHIEGTDAEIVEQVQYTSSDTDFSTMLMKIKNAGAEVIFAPNYTQELITITEQLHAIGYTGRLVNGLDAAPPFASLVGDAANGVIYINNMTESDPKISGIMEAYKTKTGIDATNKFFLGYDVAYILEKAFNEVGADPVKVRDFVENLTGFEGLTGTITVDPKLHLVPGLEVYVHEIVDGKSVFLKKYSAEQ